MIYKNIEYIKSVSNIEDFDTEVSKTISELENVLKDNPTCYPLVVVVTGSVAYGLDTPTSDIDLKGIFYQDHDYILSDLKLGTVNQNSRYKPTISNEKNDV